MAYQPGPKELAQKRLREQAFEQGQAKNKGKKPSTSELRNKISKIKGGGKPKRAGRGR